MNDRAVRVAGLAAIVFVVLILVTVFASGQPPAADDSVEKIREYLVDHRTAMLVSQLLGLLALPFAIWFSVVFRDVVRGDRMSNALGLASLAGLLVTAPMAMAGGAISISPIYVDGVANKLGDDTIRIVFEAQSLLFACTSAGIALFALTAALAIRRTRALPSYTMWLGLLAVAGNIVAMFTVLGAGASNLGFVGLLTFALFLLGAGGTMAAGKATPGNATPATV
jgi:hypothetical protein